MPNEFLDFNGLKVYDEKLKEYINKKIDEVININLFGNLGYSLTGQGNDGIPIWAQNSGFRLCDSTGEQVIKTVSSVNYKIENGGIFAIKFDYPHTAEKNAQLSVGGVVGVMKWEDGSAVTKDNTWQENETVIVCYMSNYWCILSKSPQFKAQEKAKERAEALLNAYPIGTIYSSINPKSPQELFGGTWEQIKDTFLLTAGDTYNAGETGGSATHSHSSGSLHANIGVSYTQERGNFIAYKETSGTSGEFFATTRMSGQSYQEGIQVYMGKSTVVKGNTDNASNMPPYLVVYAWKRIA